VTTIIPEGFADRLIADGTGLRRALAQQIGTGIELNGYGKMEQLPHRDHAQPLENDEGILVTAAIRDITVRKDAEKRFGKDGSQISWPS